MRLLSATAICAALAALPLAAPATAQDVLNAQGELVDADSRADDKPYDDHAVTLNAGSRYRVRAQSEAFDTIVEVRRAGTAEPLAGNDDFEGLNSQLNFTPDETGEYQIRVTTFSETGRGAYSASVEMLPPLPAPSQARPSGRERVRWQYWDGELSESDGDLDGKRYDDYLVHFTAGQTHLIGAEAVDGGAAPAAESEEEGGSGFDLIVQVFRPGEREGSPIEMDDDAGPGFDPLLGFRVDQEGDYVVRVTTFQPGYTGRYRLRIGR